MYIDHTTQGGYNLSSIAQSMTAICHVLLGDALPRLDDDDMIINDKLACDNNSILYNIVYFVWADQRFNSSIICHRV